MNILFSILVANYNNGKFFENCFESILAQTFQNWEVIIVDDASSDNSVDVIKRIVEKDSRFKIYENSSNLGVGYTKKRCIDLAQGDICAFLDPDDAITSVALAKMIEAHNSHPNVSLVYSNFVYCDKDLHPKKIRKTYQVGNNSNDFYNFNGVVSHLSSFKKKFYNKTTGLDGRMKRAIDQDLYLKLYETGEIKYIDEDLYLYRLHDGGISTNENAEKAYFWHWVALLKMAERRGLELEDLFMEKFVRKDMYLAEKKGNEKLLKVIRDSFWIKLGVKLGFVKF